MSSAGGKGSVRRPAQVSDEQYADRYALIFGRDLDTTEKRVQETQGIYTDAAEIREIFEKEDAL